MADVHLKTALQTLGHTKLIKDGSIAPPGYVLDFEEVPAIIQAFRRMVRGSEFDISEMAITTYLCARAHGKRFTALPVFVVRAFHHGVIMQNATLGLKNPKDLEGKRVGVNRGYTVTAGVWARAVLQHEHGVDLSKITWVLSGDEHVAEFKAPGNVVPVEAGKKVDEMLIAGELAAAIGVQIDHPDVKTLIPNAKEAGFAALAASGYYPINHTVVVRDEILAAHPDLAPKLFQMFAESKAAWLRQLKAGTIAEPSAMDKTFQRVMEITGADPLPYGVAPNCKMLEAIMGYATEQGIISKPFAIEELFAKGTLDLTG